MPPPGPITSAPFSLSTAGLLVENTPISVSAAGTTSIVANATKPFLFCFQKISVAAGASAYNHNFTLQVTNAVEGSIFILSFEIAGSALNDRTISTYNQSTSNVPALEILAGEPSAYYYLLHARLSGGNWQKLSGARQL